MDTMVVAVFEGESDAYEAVKQLKKLHVQNGMALYSGALITKSEDGRVHLRESKSEWPVGVTSGAAIGALLGLLGGPAGVAAGSAMGAIAGMPADVYNLGVQSDFVTEVSNQLKPGTSAVVFETEEEWRTPIDAEMQKLGGTVFRRSRTDTEDNQFDG